MTTLTRSASEGCPASSRSIIPRAARTKLPVQASLGLRLGLVLRCSTTLCALWICGPYVAQAGEEAAQKTTYDDHVRAILRDNCFKCHNQNDAKSDLSLDSYSGLMKGGASGAVIEPGDPDTSRLWLLVSHQEEPTMPPEQDKLPEPALATIRQWIAAGALENAGSTAKVKKKPAMDLSATAGSARPAGEPVLPAGLSRQPIVYTARGAAASAIAASPWAPVVAVGAPKQIVFYNTDTGELLGVVPFHEGVPQVLKFSRSGTLLLAGGGQGGKLGRAVVYDVKSGKRLFEVGEELDTVLAADINEDHTRIALGGPGRIVRVYSAEDGSLVHELKKHTEWIYAVEFSPDGVLLATADRNGGMFVWEADTGREYQTLKGHEGAITDISWRADSNVLASASEDGTVRLWEMETGTQIKSWGAHGGGASAVEFTRDGRLVSAGRDRQVKLWDANGAQQRAFDAMADLALEVAVTHDAGRVIGGDWTGEIRMWNAEDGALVAQLPSNPPTLAMVAERESARAAALAAEAQQATAELAQAEKDSVEKQAAAAAAAEAVKQKAAAAAAVAERAAAAKAAADKALAEKEAFDKSSAAQASTSP